MSLLSRPSLLLGLLVAIPCLSNSLPSIFAQGPINFSAVERLQNLSAVDLKNQLNSGLRIRTDAERAYVNRILQEVETGRIPRSMVNVVFVWARQKNEKYPLPYFQIALGILAKRIGVQLPQSDFRSIGR